MGRSYLAATKEPEIDRYRPCRRHSNAAFGPMYASAMVSFLAKIHDQTGELHTAVLSRELTFKGVRV